MHQLISILAILFLSTAAFAQSDRQLKLDAAMENAVAAMFDDVSRQAIFDKVTVRDLLGRTSGTETMLTTLRTAEQIGGPRWIDEQTVQIRLEIPGPAVAASLIEIAANAPDRSPVKAEELQPLTERWERRSFSAVGHSSAAQATSQAMGVVAAATQPARAALPFHPPRWTNQVIQADGKSGPATSKLRAARSAELDALANLRKQVDALPVGTATLGDAAKSAGYVDAAIDRSIQRAKLTRVDYLADGGANVGASLDLTDLWREIDTARQSVPVFAPR